MSGLMQGAKIGNYILERQLGEGGQGSVWQARAVGTAPGAPTVALKVIPTRGSSHVMIERFRREAQALIRLSSGHPSLVACHGIVEDEAMGVFAVVMDKVEGRDLQEVLGDPRCDARAKEIMLLHIARALAHLHEAGFVHRDIKPQNILVTNQFFLTPNDEATVKLVDFGIAVPILNPKPLTEVGTVIGTPGYMSPERIDPLFWQARQGLPTEDVFAFGVVAYEAFFGRHPTGVIDDEASLASYAERYRSVARAAEVWPPLPPSHPWTQALRGALALRAAERLPTGAAIVGVVAGGAHAALAGAKTEPQPPAPLVLTPPPYADARGQGGGRASDFSPQPGLASSNAVTQRTEVARLEDPGAAALAGSWQGGASAVPVAAGGAHDPAAHMGGRSRALVATLATLLVLGTVLLVGGTAYVLSKNRASDRTDAPLPEPTISAPASTAVAVPIGSVAPEPGVPVQAAPVAGPVQHHDGSAGHNAVHPAKPPASAGPIVNLPPAGTPTTASPTPYQPPEIRLPPILWQQPASQQPAPQQPAPQQPAPQQPAPPQARPPIIKLPLPGGGSNNPPTTPPTTPGGRPGGGGRPPPPGGG